MLLGVLDIGSNSAQLQIFEVYPGAPPLPTHAVKEPTLLSEAFETDGAVSPDGIDRVVAAVNNAMSAARRLGVEQLFVFTDLGGERCGKLGCSGRHARKTNREHVPRSTGRTPGRLTAGRMVR